MSNGNDREAAREALELQLEILDGIVGRIEESNLSADEKSNTLGQIVPEIDAVNEALDQLDNEPNVTPPTKEEMEALRTAAKDIGSVVATNAAAQAFIDATVQIARSYSSTSSTTV